MREEGEYSNRASWKYLACSAPTNRLWFVYRRDYWFQDCDLEVQRRRTHWQASLFAGLHNFDLFAILLRRHKTGFVKVSYWWRD